MTTPYEVLDVECDANDEKIKQAYLLKVKEYPPDRNQEQFQQIHNAYLSIKDYKSRISYALFSYPAADFDRLIDQALSSEQNLSFSPQQFNQLLNLSMDDTCIQNAMTDAKK